MRTSVVILALICAVYCVKVSQQSAYKVLQDEIATLNNENAANEKSIRKMRGTMKEMLNEMRDMKYSNMNHFPHQQPVDNGTHLTEADKAKLQNINKMVNEIKQMQAQVKTNASAAPAAPAPADLTKAGDSQKKEETPATKEIGALQSLGEKINALHKSMDKNHVQKQEAMTEAQMKAELKKLNAEISEIDKFAVQKIEEHKSKNHFPKTVEEKNLNRRKRYIALREKAVLEELNKKEMELHSVAPSFQGSMKESLLMIFKNEDKNRLAPAEAKKEDTPTEDKKEDTPAEDKKEDTPTEDKKEDTPTEDKKEDTPTEDIKEETPTEGATTDEDTDITGLEDGDEVVV